MNEDNIKSDKLYIIGNGFDRHHGLNTSYHGFANYLSETNHELFYLLEHFFYYSSKDEDLWCHFEENLANLDIDAMLYDYKEYLPDISSDEFRDRDMHAFPDIMQDKLEVLTTGLISEFTNFIKKVVTPNTAKQERLELDKDALFFSFNYTYTLEDLYHIDSKNILHIHNAVESRYSDIILGHGINPESFKEETETPPEGLSEEELHEWQEQQDDSWDYSYDTGKENLLQYFFKSYKPTKDIIAKNRAYFAKLSNVNKVFVLGHSLSDIDLPYYIEMVKSVKDTTKWIASYYNCQEIANHKNQLIKIGIPESNIELIKLTELKTSARMQYEINFGD